MAGQLVNDLICDKCQKEFVSKSKLDRHKANKNGCKIKLDDYICNNCDKKFSNKYNLLRHQKKCLQEDVTNTMEDVPQIQNNTHVVSDDNLGNIQKPEVLSEIVKLLGNDPNQMAALLCTFVMSQQKQNEANY
jgi:hypothetical protein